jgi:tetratricopeptide (TPR) repeat protein
MSTRRQRQARRATQAALPPASRRRTARVLGTGAILVAVTLLAYLPALQAGFIWDDDDYVTKNEMLRTLNGLRRIWLEPGSTPQHYPLTFTSFWLEYHLWGLQPFGYHLVNVLLHALNALLFWRVLRVLDVPGAWLAATVFALHPMHVESVAWITERKNVLSGAFYLGAALAYLRFSPPRVGQSPGSGLWYALALGLFTCALLGKTVTASLPAALLLVSWWKRGHLERRDLAVVPMFALGLIASAITVWMERTHVGAQGVAWNLSWLDRCLIAGRALWFYAATVVWPRNLTFIYPRWHIDAGAWWQSLFPLAAAAVAAAAYMGRRRIGTGTLVALLFFAGTLFPGLGFFDVYPMRYSFVADHFAYLASLGLIAWLCAAAVTIAGRWKLPGGRRAAYCTVPILALLGVMTWQQSRVYTDLHTLWTDTLAKNPDSWIAHNNLGTVALDEGAVEKAVAHFSAAVRLWPAYAEAHNNLGNALRAQGRLVEAVAHYEEALRLEPVFVSALNNLGGALAAQGRVEEGLDRLAAALRIQPTVEVHFNVATLLLQQGRTQDAAGHFAAALRLAPDHAPSHLQLGLMLAQQQRLEEALPHLSRVLALRPGDVDAHYTVATVLLEHGRNAEAASLFEAVLRLAPDHGEAHNNFGALRLRQGRTDEAIAEFRAATRLRPDDPATHANLALALEMQGRFPEAVSSYDAVLRLRPDDAGAHRNLGIVHARLGNPTAAKVHLQEALRLAPDDGEARAALEQIGTDPPASPVRASK